MIGAGPFRIQGQGKLSIPIKAIASATHLIIPLSGSRTLAGNICRMGGNFIGNDAVAHILGIG